MRLCSAICIGIYYRLFNLFSVLTSNYAVGSGAIVFSFQLIT